MNAIIIGTESIREQDGLYSLNDLHRASGGLASQKPSEWLRNKQAQELVDEITKAGIPALLKKHGGRTGSQTYACRELVIAYAAWISAAFHLKVIRVFLAQQDKKEVKPSAYYSSPKMAMTKTQDQISNLYALCNIMLLGAERWPDLYQALDAMQSPFASQFYDIFMDGKMIARNVMRGFERELQEVVRAQVADHRVNSMPPAAQYLGQIESSRAARPKALALH